MMDEIQVSIQKQLKPCPFCGSTELYLNVMDSGEVLRISVDCKCGVSVENIDKCYSHYCKHTAMNDMLQLWNKRCNEYCYGKEDTVDSDMKLVYESLKTLQETVNKYLYEHQHPDYVVENLKEDKLLATVENIRLKAYIDGLFKRELDDGYGDVL